jgi:peptide/nickel transport system permease protein
VLKLILRRLALSIPVLLFLTLMLFLALKLIPGDAAVVMAGERATAEQVDYIRRSLHLDQPWYVQYGLYLWNLVSKFDLGRSLFHDRPILELLQTTVPATVELGLYALLIAIPVGITLGALGAVFRNTWVDRATAIYSLAGVSMPIFWLALMLMYLFSIVLGWLPTSGRLGDEVLFDPALDSITKMYTIDGLIIWIKSGDFSVLSAALRHIFLPAFALSTIPMAQVCRMSRSSFLEVLNQDYIRTARAKGVSPFLVPCKS